MTKHHLLVLLHPLEHTSPAAALMNTQLYPHAWSLSHPRILQLGAACIALLCGLSETGFFMHGLQVAGANHCSYH